MKKESLFVARSVAILFLIAFLIWVFMVVSFVAPVSAQVPTSTPQNTVTPTPTLDCPEGLPVGWGTYTPSPLWYLECEECLLALTPTVTALPSVTPTHSGTGTPYPTITPTVTATITPTATASLGGMECLTLVSGDVECWEGNVLTYEYEVYTETFANNQDFILFTILLPSTYDAVTFYWSYELTTSWSGAHSSYAPGVEEVFLVSLNPPGPAESPFVWSDPGGCEAGVSGSCVWTEEHSEFIDLEPGHDAHVMMTWKNYNVWWPSGANNVSGTMYVSVVGFPVTSTPTPVVTSTPVETLSCGTVTSFDSGFDFELFVPDGPANCSMGWDEFGVLEYTVPAVQICLQPVQFGVIRLFGKDYEVGSYGLVGAVAFLFRFLKII